MVKSSVHECGCLRGACVCVGDERPRGDLGAAVQMLAADNARMCDILLAADKLADAIEKKLRVGQDGIAIRAALAAYKVVRQGQ